MAVAAMLH